MIADNDKLRKCSWIISSYSRRLIVLEILSLWVNPAIRVFVNWCNCFNDGKIEAPQRLFSCLSSATTITLPALSLIGLCFQAFLFVWSLSERLCVAFRDAKCGKIQCQGGANRPVIGTNAVSIETNIPLQEGGRILCRGTHVYLGDDMPDPGLVLAGTKCGDGTVSRLHRHERDREWVFFLPSVKQRCINNVLRSLNVFTAVP